MAESLAIALQLSLIGLGLVFGTIAMLWVVLWLLVRLTAERTAQVTIDDRELKRRAVVAAVAVALAREAESRVQAFPLPQTATISAWQAVMRGNQLKQRGPVR